MRFNRSKSCRVEAAEWVAAFREGPGTPEERRQFVDWLQESPLHVAEYLEIASLWHEIGEVAKSVDVRAMLDEQAHTVTPLRPQTAAPAAAGDRRAEPAANAVARTVRRALAGLIAAAVLAVAGWWLAPRAPEPVEYRTGIGEQRSLPLADGSIVSLNTQSKIRVDLRESVRRLELVAGEALFDVAPDPDRPFIVAAGNTEIRAVGTSFNVYRQEDNTVAVTVLEGRVALAPVAARPAAPARPAAVGPARAPSGPGAASGAADAATAARPPVIELGIGQQAYVGAAAVDVVPAAADVERVMAWTERRLIFENDTLADVVAEFNRYNADKLDVLDAELAQLRLSGVFQAHDPGSMIEFLQRSRSVRVLNVGGDRRLLVP